MNNGLERLGGAGLSSSADRGGVALPPPDSRIGNTTAAELAIGVPVTQEPATRVTLSKSAKSESVPRLNYDEEYAKDPMQAAIKFRQAYIASDKAFLEKLDSDDKPIDLRTGLPISNPEHIALLKESTLRAIKENEKVLNETLTIAAGGQSAALSEAAASEPQATNLPPAVVPTVAAVAKQRNKGNSAPLAALSIVNVIEAALTNRQSKQTGRLLDRKA
jgi:hypothetical protein